MANTVLGGPYVAHAWNNGDSATATRLDNIESQSGVALHAFNPDLIGAGFVLSGCAASGTVGTTTVNIASGRAYTVMTDGTVGCIVVGSATQTTATPSTTYHLYLQPDGTFYWSTSNSPQTNSLHIADVATNGSGQISTITDFRNLNPILLPSLSSYLEVPAGFVFGGLSSLTSTPASEAGLYVSTGINATVLTAPLSGTANGILFVNWDGSARHFPLSVGGQFGSAVTYIKQDGSFGQIASQATAGSYGVPVMVAETKEQNVVNTTKTTIATWTAPSSGSDSLVRVWMRCYVGSGNTNNGTISLTFTASDPQLGSGPGTFIQTGTTTAISGISGTKGTPTNAYATQFPISSGGSVTLSYQNTAAGTISDLVWATIELLA